MAKKDPENGEPVIIKKYANRRLYNTQSSSYVTLDDLAGMVRAKQDFVVRDAKSGKDITHSVLTQIIFEEESKGETLLPVNFLRQLISFYGDGLQQVVPDYLESSMSAFTQNQDQFRSFITDNFTPDSAFSFKSFKPFEDMTRQNMAAFQQAMQMFTPSPATKEEPGKKPDTSAESSDQLSELQEQLKVMQSQINDMQKDK